MLNRIVWNRTVFCMKIDLALNNLQRLICHKIQTTKPDSLAIIHVIACPTTTKKKTQKDININVQWTRFSILEAWNRLKVEMPLKLSNQSYNYWMSLANALLKIFLMSRLFTILAIKCPLPVNNSSCIAARPLFSIALVYYHNSAEMFPFFFFFFFFFYEISNFYLFLSKFVYVNIS